MHYSVSAILYFVTRCDCMHATRPKLANCTVVRYRVSTVLYVAYVHRSLSYTVCLFCACLALSSSFPPTTHMRVPDLRMLGSGESLAVPVVLLLRNMDCFPNHSFSHKHPVDRASRTLSRGNACAAPYSMDRSAYDR